MVGPACLAFAAAEDFGSRDGGANRQNPSSRKTLQSCHAIAGLHKQEHNRCCRRPWPDAVVAGEGALGGGEAGFGRLPRSDWQATAFSAFLPLCLEDSRAPPQPISTPIPPLGPLLSIELLPSHSSTTQTVCLLARSHLYPL
jgi:hypothetical protein